MTISSRTLAVYATSLSLLLSGCGNGGSESVSSSAAASAAAGPAILTQPAAAAIVSGSNSVLSVVASGTSPTYQWYLDGAAIDGATGATYTATAGGTYYVVVTAAEGAVTSANAIITLGAAPVISAQPLSATILGGTSQTLSVVADGAELAYQWYQDGVAIAAATHASYTASAAGSYTVTVTNSAGSVTSTATAISVSASVTAPVINVQPVAQTVNAGAAVVLWTAANGVSLSYQWYRNDAPLAGATERIYRITAANANSAGTYKVVATNTAGSATSAAVAVKVNVSNAGANTASVVNAANAFLATLSAEQKAGASAATSSATVQFDYALANAIQWTNLPGERHGMRLNTTNLTAAQLAAANTVIARALGATGISLLNELRAADQVLASAQGSGGAGGGTPGTVPADGGGGFTAPTDGGGVAPPDGAMPGGTAPGGGTGGALGYGADLYSIALVGTPSLTKPWMLQVAGHHLAYNITYNTGKVSATPTFVGVEPPNWSVGADGAVSVSGNAGAAGRTHAPMEKQRAAVYNLAEAIHADAITSAAARLPGTFTDVLMGASGNSDGNFKSLAYPTSGRGLAYTAMNATQQAYVRAAIEAWVNTQAADVAAALLGDYLSDTALATTYVGYGVGQNGLKADFSAFPNGQSSPLEAQRSYLRVDGPRVWIEFVVQQGVVYGTDVHYHTIWRDKTADYGGSF